MEFRDLKKQYEVLKDEIDFQICEVINSSKFISGPQVCELENKLADYVGVKNCISCANGTDAITLALMAFGIKEGDAVFVPDFTFFSTGECPTYIGATPFFVDVLPDTYNIDADKLEWEIKKVKSEGKYIPRCVIAVDLFGQPAEYDRIRKVCNKYNLYLLEDGAQGFGGSIDGKKACSFGDISTTSFFPAKPLGCYGDGGAIFTDNDKFAGILRSLAVHGKSGSDKYDNIRIGMNSRLDTIQAAILLTKLKQFEDYELNSVNNVAEWYSAELANTDLVLPLVKEGYVSSWAQYTVQLPKNIEREIVQTYLKDIDIPTMVYYKKPLHLQGAFNGTISSYADCDVTMKLCESVLSLPMHPYLTKDDVVYICNEIKNIIGKAK